MEENKKMRIMTIFIMIACVLILAISNFILDKVHEFENAKLRFQIIEDNLNSVQESLEKTKNRAIEDFYFIETLTKQYGQTLELVNAKLLDVENFLSELENSEKSEMRTIYDEAKEKLNEAIHLSLEVNVGSILSRRDQIITNTNNTCGSEEVVLEIVREALDSWDYDKLDISDAYNKYNELYEFATSIRESTQKMADDIKPSIDNVRNQRMSLQIGGYQRRLREFQNIIEEYEHIEAVRQALLEKLNSFLISENTDMSKPIGFTEEELHYLLESIGFVRERNPEIIDVLPSVMVETVKEYPVNELFSIAVMSFETGYFRSYLAMEKFNYGGLLGADGKGLTYASMEEGLAVAIQCLYKNLKGSNTIFEINETYCAPTDLNGDGKIEGIKELFHWSTQVMSIMERYKNAALKEPS